MNTLDDLDREFERLAALAPDWRELARDLPAGLAARRARRDRRRRTVALVAVAASVVLIAGGISVTAGLMKSHPGSAQPAAPSPVVAVPDIPLPAGSKLQRLALKPVESPVTATPPAGLTGVAWIQSPGRLAVSYFDRAAVMANGGAPVVTDSASGVTSAGYVVTDSASEDLTTSGAGGSQSVTATSRDITIAGHAARLDVAPDGATDGLGFPAAQRISWKLADGRYIHVWATDGSGDAGFGWTSYSPLSDTAPSGAGPVSGTSVMSFAATITEKSTQLYRAVGIGLTLPGLTVDSSMNVPVVGGFTPESLMMCPAGVDPLAVPSGSSSPAASCFSAGVVNIAASAMTDLTGSRITVAGRSVVVAPDSASATTRLDNGATVVVTPPADREVSADDLAAVAASVRLSPDVTVIPTPISESASTLPLPAGEASIAGVAGLVSGGAASSSAVVTSSSATPVSPAHALIEVLGAPDHEFYIGVNHDDRTGEIQVSIKNTSDAPVTVESLTVGAATVDGATVVSPGITLDDVQVRLDNTAADADQPFQDGMLPMQMAPGATVRLRLEFAVGQCTSLVAPDLPVDLGYEAPSGSSGSVNLAASWGVEDWVGTFSKYFCS